MRVAMNRVGHAGILAATGLANQLPHGAPHPGCQSVCLAYVGRVDWQQPIALLIVAVAAALLLWRQFRPRRPLEGKRGAGCCAATGSSPQGSIVFRARKGERRQIIVRNP